MPASSSKVTVASFSTETDSPVREDSSIFKLVLSVRRKSAGTISPVSNTTKSPGTTRTESISTGRPPRITFTVGELIFFKAAMASSALPSCTMLKTAFTMTMARIITESTISPTAPEIIAAIKSMMIMGSRNCSASFLAKDLPSSSCNSLVPYLPRRFSASSGASPFLSSADSSSRTSRTLILYQSMYTSSYKKRLLSHGQKSHSLCRILGRAYAGLTTKNNSYSPLFRRVVYQREAGKVNENR